MTINNPTPSPFHLRVRGSIIAFAFFVVLYLLLGLLGWLGNVVWASIWIAVLLIAIIGASKAQHKYLAQGVLIFLALSLVPLLVLALNLLIYGSVMKAQ